MCINQSPAFKFICEVYCENLITTCIDHCAIPYVVGISCETLSQEKWEKAGGKGKKPKPLSHEKKLNIYQQLEKGFRPLIEDKIQEFVRNIMSDRLRFFNEIELEAKVKELKEKFTIRPEPDWNTVNKMTRNYLYLHQEFERRGDLDIDPKTIHDRFCKVLIKNNHEIYNNVHL
jgi:hypothetical protein